MGSDQVTATVWDYYGPITDGAGCQVAYYDMADASHTIVYTYKEGADSTAPGDTVDFTVYYGRPGTSNLSSIEIIDTQPPYTHYIPGSASPSPDPGWDPEWGPPLRLKWTILPPLSVTGGPTGMVTFQLSIDWGNEDIDVGSGDVAAPERYRLENRAQVFFNGITACSVAAPVTMPVTTVVRRFLFFMIGDNDILFSPSLGQPPDEIIYEMFVKNLSARKTWWNVSIWDTVPPQIDTFCQDCGFDDPCLGWTMTPSGCASASPGVVINGSNTIMTWKLDMPPLKTLALRWKGRVRPTVSAGDTAINRMSILEMGWIGVVDGTGHSGVVRTVTHLAPIILPTTYISYASLGATTNEKTDYCDMYLPFFPLNKRTQFELRGLQYVGGGWAAQGGGGGGISASIGLLIGDCVGGFPGGGGIPGGGFSGCKAERIPAKYEPTAYLTTCPAFPFHFIYKVTSNSPVLWQVLVKIAGDFDDQFTYAPSTTITYSGLMHYLWRRPGVSQGAGYGDSLTLINTSADPLGTPSPGLETTVHLFKFDYANLDWDYVRTYELGAESLGYDMGTVVANEGPWRIASSDARLIVNQAVNAPETLGCCCVSCANDYVSFMPTRETGNVVSQVGGGTMYGIVGGLDWPRKVVIGNTGSVIASYRVSHYVPNSTLTVPPQPPLLNDTSGHWIYETDDSVPPGLTAAANPRIYGGGTTAFSKANKIALHKVEILSGGPIQVLHGLGEKGGLFNIWEGGTFFNSADGNQVGTEFWLNHTYSGSDCGGYGSYFIDVFCPKAGMVVQAVSEDGYSAKYTTSGPDQCVAFGALTTPGGKRNYRINVLAGPSYGNVMALYLQCYFGTRGYTAPFLATGVHYQIVTPPVVYMGQSFWLTVVVLETAGTTKADYDGVTTFSSTDPAARIEGTAMASYDYAWQGSGYENGVRIFVNVVFNQLGLQTIVASDTLDGSITGLGAVMVVAADVKLSKEPRLTIASSGEAIQFRICWSNYSSATATNFTITDAVPMGTTYIPEAASLLFCGAGGPAIPTVTVAYGGPSATTPAVFNTLTSPTQTAPASTRWLRWTVGDVYVYSTGCVCFRVRVD